MSTTTRHDTTKRTGRQKTTTTVWEGTVDASLFHANQFKWKEAEERGGNTVPAHYHAKIMGVDVHLRDGLQPGALMVVRLEVRNRAVNDDRGTADHLSLNLYPALGEASQHRLLIGKHGVGEVIERRNGAITLLPIEPAESDDDDLAVDDDE